MQTRYNLTAFLTVAIVSIIVTASADDPSFYVKKDSWHETMLASREALRAQEQSEGGGVSLDMALEEYTVATWVRSSSAEIPIFIKSAGPGSEDETGTKTFYFAPTVPELIYITVVPKQEPLSEDQQTDEVPLDGLAEALGRVGGLNIRDGEWHHVAMSSGNSRHKFYIDGKLVNSETLWNFNRLTPDNPIHSIYLGGHKSQRFGRSTLPLVGDLDEFQLFSRLLTADEVLALTGNPGAVEEGLAGWWSFDDLAKDVSGLGNDGEVTNSVFVNGKFGKAIHLEGNGYVKVPARPGKEPRDKIWSLVADAFSDEVSAKQMAWEAEDGIWAGEWLPGDMTVLAARYALSTRDYLGLSVKAKRLAKTVENTSDLAKVREVYHLSRLYAGNYERVRTKADRLLQEVDYLQEIHPADDTKWNRFRESVIELWENCKKAMAAVDAGDEGAIKDLKTLSSDIDELKNRVPLRLPSGPPGTAQFGAVYKKLKFSLDWDKPWRISKDADVVVRFDEFNHRFVFWHGTSYIPCWATYDGAWYTNEFFERRGWLAGGDSMMEPMSDKQARYSHVRIIENHKARVVVHWRYTSADLNYKQGYIDPVTGWGDWVDEYYTIYPDAIGVRKATIRSSGLEDWIEYQESIVINQPGTIPEDNIEFSAVTLGNLKGESKTFVWTEDGGPAFDDAPQYPCIQIVNFKNPHRPFFVVDPEGVAVRPYAGHAPGSHFNFWNHWPVAQAKSDGTVATSGDKPSHSSLSLAQWKVYSREEQEATWIMLHGMTDKTAPDLVPLANSWLTPPRLKIKSPDFEGGAYDPTQRAYILSCKNNSQRPLTVEIAADQKSPLVNLALVIKDWGETGATLQINGRNFKLGKDFRLGFRRGFQKSDLIVWIIFESTEPLEILLTPK